MCDKSKQANKCQTTINTTLKIMLSSEVKQRDGVGRSTEVSESLSSRTGNFESEIGHY